MRFGFAGSLLAGGYVHCPTRGSSQLATQATLDCDARNRILIILDRLSLCSPYRCAPHGQTATASFGQSASEPPTHLRAAVRRKRASKTFCTPIRLFNATALALPEAFREKITWPPVFHRRRGMVSVSLYDHRRHGQCLAVHSTRPSAGRQPATVTHQCTPGANQQLRNPTLHIKACPQLTGQTPLFYTVNSSGYTRR